LGKRALWLPAKFLREALGVLGLEREVELGGDGAVELIDEGARRVDLRLGDGALDEREQGVEQLEIARDGLAHARALHLDDDVLGAPRGA
jgi:hypothetical protein